MRERERGIHPSECRFALQADWRVGGGSTCISSHFQSWALPAPPAPFLQGFIRVSPDGRFVDDSCQEFHFHGEGGGAELGWAEPSRRRGAGLQQQSVGQE